MAAAGGTCSISISSSSISSIYSGLECDVCLCAIKHWQQQLLLLFLLSALLLLLLKHKQNF